MMISPPASRACWDWYDWALCSVVQHDASLGDLLDTGDVRGSNLHGAVESGYWAGIAAREAIKRINGSFAGLGIHQLIALDDSRQCKGDTDGLLRQEIAERYNRTRDNGGTTLSFQAWKEVFRRPNVAPAVL